MTDNIKPEHYRKGEIDLYEAWYRTYPFNEYRAIMQAVAERYMRRDKNDRVEDLGKAIYTLERLREKEIERAAKTANKDYGDVDKGKFLIGIGYKYLARDLDNELWAYKFPPKKGDTQWVAVDGDYIKKINIDIFQEVNWTDDEPAKISELLASYENGGGNGK